MLSFEATSVVMWSLTAFTILLTAGRFYIRHHVRRKFFADDYMHLFALIWLIINSSISQAMFIPAKYVVFATKQHPPPPAQVMRFRQLQTPLTLSFMISHWSVKFSFLFFYRLLFWVSEPFMRAWWVITTITFITLFVPIAGNVTKCGSPKDINNPVACANHKHYQQVVNIYVLAVNVSTDLAIMILPLFMLPNLHIRRSQKIGLGLIFSICGVTIGLEILRVYKTLPGGVFGNVILYGILEANFSVIVSCIPTYRSLLGVERRTKGKDYAHWDWSKRSKTARSAGDDTALTKSQTNSNRSLTGIKVNQTWEQISEVRDSSTDSVQLNTMPPTAVLKG